MKNRKTQKNKEDYKMQCGKKNANSKTIREYIRYNKMFEKLEISIYK